MTYLHRHDVTYTNQNLVRIEDNVSYYSKPIARSYSISYDSLQSWKSVLFDFSTVIVASRTPESICICFR